MDAKDKHVLGTMLEAARWAVSADNGQPWKFHWRESRLFLLLDSGRASSFFDGRQYAAYLGLGSLLENLCIAAQHLGYQPHLELLPALKLEEEQVVASISFSPSPAQGNALYAAVLQRATNRRPYHKTTVASQVRTDLLASVQESASFKIVLVDDSTLRKRLASLTAGAEAIRFDFTRKEVHADFFSCLRFSRKQAEQSGDGLWVRCLEPGLHGALALQLLASWPFAAVAARLGAHYAFTRQSIYLLRRTPLVALVIVSPARPLPDEQDFLQAGRVCQRLWLTATRHGLACQPMAALPLFFLQHASFGDEGFPGNAGNKIRTLRAEFNKAFNLAPSQHLMMVFRLGYAKAPSARSFRRPVSDLLAFSDESPLVAQRTP